MNRKPPEDTSHLEVDRPVDRRDFLRLAGYSVGTGVLGAACSRLPAESAVPFLVQPEEIVPGDPVRYATVCGACSAGCGVLATCLEGRPVKLEGNPDHPISRGALCAVGQASILELYDSTVVDRPLRDGNPISWDSLDSEIIRELEQIRQEGKPLAVVSGTIHSPLIRHQIGRFLADFPASRWISYDPVSSSAIPEAHRLTHGVRRLPHYQLDRVELLVGFEADFLGTWISPVEFSQGYRDGRTLEGSRLRYSFHVQFESALTLTGSKADQHWAVPPDAVRLLIGELLRLVSDRVGNPVEIPPLQSSLPAAEALIPLADRLSMAPGRALILCGSQDVATQVLVNRLNELLQSYRRTIDLTYPSYQRLGDESGFVWLRDRLREDSLGALLVIGSNPVYDLPFGDELGDGFRRVPASIGFPRHEDETSATLRFAAPVPHYLESWGDAQPTARVLSLRQPAVRRLGQARSLVESLARWRGDHSTDYQLLRRFWQQEIFPRRFGFAEFEQFWNESLHDGVAKVRTERAPGGTFDSDGEWLRMEPVGGVEPDPVAAGNSGLHLVLHPTVGIRESQHSSNPWLLELPDPLTRLSWRNCAVFSPELARRLEIKEGQVVTLEVSQGGQVNAPALILKGQQADTVSLGLGFGTEASRRLSSIGPTWLGRSRGGVEPAPVGVRGSHLVAFDGRLLTYSRALLSVRPTGQKQVLARAQTEDLVQPLDPLTGAPTNLGIERSLTLNEFLSARPLPEIEKPRHLWREDHTYTGHRWGMAIDLGACTGCSACVLACQAENNIPVVGPDESARSRQMHWIRIDRYYASDSSELYFLPVMCQHCDRAPCETVCPVLATVHGEEGLNQQIYNRCIGTRYCANNCPYKVRTFNWFDYDQPGERERLRLNPAVTVRTRGVVEKCTFCVQRIQAARNTATVEGRSIAEGEVQTACQQTCPSRAIYFGDLNDPNSEISRLTLSPRGFHLLEPLGTLPSVVYLSKVINQEKEGV